MWGGASSDCNSFSVSHQLELLVGLSLSFVRLRCHSVPPSMQSLLCPTRTQVCPLLPGYIATKIASAGWCVCVRLPCAHVLHKQRRSMRSHGWKSRTIATACELVCSRRNRNLFLFCRRRVRVKRIAPFQRGPCASEQRVFQCERFAPRAFIRTVYKNHWHRQLHSSRSCDVLAFSPHYTLTSTANGTFRVLCVGYSVERQKPFERAAFYSPIFFPILTKF